MKMLPGKYRYGRTWEPEPGRPVELNPAGTVVRMTVEVTDPCGLHLRSASVFAVAAQRYVAEIWILHRDGRHDAKSILDVLTIAAECGSHLSLEATGPDADEALLALARLDSICRAV